MKKRTRRIVAICFVAPLALVVAVQPSISETNDLLAQKASQAEYYAKVSQGNIFHIPNDTSDVIWNPMYDRHDMIHKVSLGYTRLPKSRTTKQFEEMFEFASKYIGVRYTLGGRSPSTGFDCSGFTSFVFSHFGSNMTMGSSVNQYDYCYSLPGGYEKPGDLVFFKGTGSNSEAIASHVGIYIGEGKMIHAGNSGVSIVDLNNEYWPKHFMCFARPYEW